MSAETKPSAGLLDPYSEEQMRLFLPEGDCFRAAFVDDDFVKSLTPKDAYDRKKNKFVDSITFVGPYAPKTEPPSRAKIFICDPNSGAVCVEKIVANLAHHAWRRPVTKVETASLLKFVALAKANGQSTEQGIQLALQAMLVSPHFLSRIERDANPLDAARSHPVTDISSIADLAISCGVHAGRRPARLAEAGSSRPATSTPR
jgi:hypothetical protein